MNADVQFLEQFENWVGIITVAVTSIIGFYRYNKISLPCKIMLYSTIFGFTTSRLGFFLIPLANYDIAMCISYYVYFIMVSVFFNYCIEQFRKIRMGLFMTAAGFLFGIIYTLFFEPIGFNSFNRSFTYYASFFDMTCIALSIAALYIMLRENKWKEVRDIAVFWILVIQLLGSGISLAYDLTVPLIKNNEIIRLASVLVDWLPNDVSVILLGIIFLRFPKKIATLA